MTASDESKRGPVVQDWVIALVVAVIQVAGGRNANLRQTGVHSLDAFGYLLLLIGPVALLVRRSHPLPALLVTIAALTKAITSEMKIGP